MSEANREAAAQAKDTGDGPSRTGRQTTALSVQVGERRLCLYYRGRRQAGENLDALLTKREPQRENPVVLSDALSSNKAEETPLLRCHC